MRTENQSVVRRTPRVRSRVFLGRAVLLVVGLAFACEALAACGGATGPRVSSPMSARDTEVFDNSVDYVANPADLGSAWGPASAAAMEHRVGAADIVAVVTVRAVRSDTDNASHRARRIVCDVQSALLGRYPGEFALTVGELESGFDTVDGRESQLLTGRFVAFVKWASEDARGVVPRWHLVPASDPNMSDVNRLVRRRTSGTSGN